MDIFQNFIPYKKDPYVCYMSNLLRRNSTYVNTLSGILYMDINCLK